MPLYAVTGCVLLAVFCETLKHAYAYLCRGLVQGRLLLTGGATHHEHPGHA